MFNFVGIRLEWLIRGLVLRPDRDDLLLLLIDFFLTDDAYGGIRTEVGRRTGGGLNLDLE